MHLEPEKGSCALAVLKLCMWVMCLLSELPIRLHTRPGSQVHLPFQQPVLDIFSRYYMAGFCPSSFIVSPNTLAIRTHQIAEPMKPAAGDLSICAPPETPTGFRNAGNHLPSVSHGVRRPHHTEPETHRARPLAQG